MLRGPITADDFKGQFSGHETFPLRHLWLRKAFDAVQSGAPRTIFSSPESIVTFGVGKNMALAIRHWALACGVIEEKEARVGATELGRSLFGGESPWNPFMEMPATAWLVQWQVAGDPKMTTTWYWAFNHLAAQTFDHEALSSSILQYARARQWSRIADKTVTRDVECFIRSYVPRIDKVAGEDALELSFAEASDSERIIQMFVAFHAMVVRDGRDPQVVHTAFLEIDEYRAIVDGNGGAESYEDI